MKIPFATQSYQARSLPLSAQRVCNLFAESAPPDARSPVVLYGTPGLALFGTIGAGPIRAMHVMGTTLFVVSGDRLYSVNSAGTGTDLGKLAGRERTNGAVYLADNGRQLMAVNSDGKGTVWDGSTLTPITDPDFPRASSVSYVDGYFIFTRRDSGQWFISDLLEATTYDALDFATAETYPDNLVRVFVDHREVWLFGTKSTEVWSNTGSADFPFQRIAGAILERGCAAPGSVAKLDNTLFFLGDDAVVYRAAGYQPQRISTHAIEHAIEGYATLADGLAFTYAQEGHSFYCLTFPNDGDSHTWVYDASTNLWHERESRDDEGRSLGRWRINAYADAYNQHIVGDYANGRLYTLDLDEATEDGTTIRREAVSVPLAATGARLSMSRLEIELETGVGATTGLGTEPQAMLQFSDDGGRTWSNERWATLGRVGQYRRRVRWYRLGQFRERYLRLTIADPVKVALIGATTAMEKGWE